MANLLMVAEKPSAARSIASALGVRENGKHKGYIEGYSEYFGYTIWVTWCLGHLVQMSFPEAYDSSFATWRLEDLPIIPEEFKYEVIPETNKQFQIVANLMNSVGESEQDRIEKSTLLREKQFLVPVTELVECTDAGREGELIFRLVYYQCHCQKPFRRLWISSMEDAAIRDGFAHLRHSSEYDALYQAALCREHADWLVGINATRFFSCLYGQTLAVGRVMTPTLSMIVARDAEIAAFQEEPFYTVRLQIDGVTVESRKFKDNNEAESLKNACMKEGEALILRMERKQKTKQPPALYDLTSLQRDANRMLGFTAQQTLQYAQSLYEKKLITYPRTDSRYLTEDLAKGIADLIRSMAAVYGMREIPVIHTEQMIDNSKVTDHHAILPTKIMPQFPLSELPFGEQAVLKLIAARLLAASGEPYRYEEVIAFVSCAKQELTAKETVLLASGWKETEEFFGLNRKKARETSPAGSLEEFSEGTFVIVQKAEIHEGKTSPPRPYTEDTLLQAMETAAAKDMPKEAERKGIGTPATRASTIEKLIQKGFVERKGNQKAKSLCATRKGTALITVMPEQIQSPLMTADWEAKLLGIERGTYSPDRFMKEIREMIETLISTYEVVRDAEILLPFENVTGLCPHCGSVVVEKKTGWFCVSRDCRFALWKDNAFFESIGKTMTKEIAETLLSSGNVRLDGCRSKRTGKSFDTTLLLETGTDGSVSYRMEFGKKKQEGTAFERDTRRRA